jgi:hypothetical protein
MSQMPLLREEQSNNSQDKWCGTIWEYLQNHTNSTPSHNGNLSDTGVMRVVYTQLQMLELKKLPVHPSTF